MLNKLATSIQYMDIALIAPSPWELDQLNMLGLTSHDFHLRADAALLEYAYTDSFLTTEPLLEPQAFKDQQLPLLDEEMDLLQFFDPWYALIAWRCQTPTILSLHDTDFVRAVEEEQPLRLFKTWVIEQAAVNVVDHVVTGSDAKVAPYYIWSDLSVLNPEKDEGKDYLTIYKQLQEQDKQEE